MRLSEQADGRRPIFFASFCVFVYEAIKTPTATSTAERFYRTLNP